MSNQTNNKRQQIIWVDSSSNNRWTGFDEVQELTPCNITSIGFIQNETDEFVTIAAHRAEHEVDGVMCIPKVCIKSRKDI